jgi:hypothetical protein
LHPIFVGGRFACVAGPLLFLVWLAHLIIFFALARLRSDRNMAANFQTRATRLGAPLRLHNARKPFVRGKGSISFFFFFDYPFLPRKRVKSRRKTPSSGKDPQLAQGSSSHPSLRAQIAAREISDALFSLAQRRKKYLLTALAFSEASHALTADYFRL